jgi:hypothetical protein
MEEASAEPISFSKYHADEREQSVSSPDPALLEQPQPNADRKERLRRARLQDALLGVFVLYPRRVQEALDGHD